MDTVLVLIIDYIFPEDPPSWNTETLNSLDEPASDINHAVDTDCIGVIAIIPSAHNWVESLWCMEYH